METRDSEGTLIEVGDTVRRTHSFPLSSATKKEVKVTAIQEDRVWGDDGFYTMLEYVKVITPETDMETRDAEGTLIEIGDTVRRIHDIHPESSIKKEVEVKNIEGAEVWGDDGCWTFSGDLKVIATPRIKDADGRIIRVGDRLAYADTGDPLPGNNVVKSLSWAGYAGTEIPTDAVTFEDDEWIHPKYARVIDDSPKDDDAPVAEAADASYTTIGAEIGRLVTEKQAAYGDAFGKAGQVLRIMYPDGISHEQMDDALTITRILDKLFRIATDKDAFGESPYRDIAGYCLLAVNRKKEEQRDV